MIFYIKKNTGKSSFQKLLKTDAPYLSQSLYKQRMWKFINLSHLSYFKRSHELTFFNDSYSEV